MPTQLTPQQLTALGQIAGTKIFANDGVYDAACWNWALHGAAGGPDPRDLYGSVSDWATGGYDARQLEERRDAHRDTAHAWPFFSADPADQRRARRTELRAIRDFLDENRGRNRAEARRRVFGLALRVAGLEVSDVATPYRIVARADDNQDVIDDHWWIELNGTHTVETVPGVPVLLETEAVVALHEGLEGRPIEELEPRFQAAYLTRLTDQHIAVIEALLAAPAFPQGDGGVRGLGAFTAWDRAANTAPAKAAVRAAWEQNAIPVPAQPLAAQ